MPSTPSTILATQCTNSSRSADRVTSRVPLQVFASASVPSRLTTQNERKKAIDVLRKAGQDFVARLAEDRFVEPLANVWPPSAPRELISRFSQAIRSAPTGYFDAGEYDGKDLDSVKRSLYSARNGVQAVVGELEQGRTWPSVPTSGRVASCCDKARLQSGVAMTGEIVAPAVKVKRLPRRTFQRTQAAVRGMGRLSSPRQQDARREHRRCR